MLDGLLFSGTTVLSLDPKGRIALPTKYRQIIKDECEGECYIAKSLFDNCLWLYPKSQWDSVVSSITKINTLSQNTLRAIQRTLLGSAVYCKLDAQGRILIPQELRDICYFDKKAILIGINNKFEIWSDSALQDQRKIDADLLKDLKDSDVLCALSAISL